MASQSPKTLAEERSAQSNTRAWTRITSDEPVKLAHGGTQIGLQVCDESYGGIGLIAPADIPLEVNQPIMLSYRGAPMRGTVKFVCAIDDQKQRFGVEWAKYSPPSPAAGSSGSCD